MRLLSGYMDLHCTSHHDEAQWFKKKKKKPECTHSPAVDLKTSLRLVCVYQSPVIPFSFFFFFLQVYFLFYFTRTHVSSKKYSLTHHPNGLPMSDVGVTLNHKFSFSKSWFVDHDWSTVGRLRLSNYQLLTQLGHWVPRHVLPFIFFSKKKNVWNNHRTSGESPHRSHWPITVLSSPNFQYYVQ